MKIITKGLSPVKLITLLLMFFTSVSAQLSFQTLYQIKNNTGLAVTVDFTVSCNKGTAFSEAKLIAIPAHQTYTVPAPYLNQARTYTDCDINIQVTGVFGSKVVNFEHQTSKYNEDMGLYNTSVKDHPVGIIVWSPTVTQIW